MIFLQHQNVARVFLTRQRESDTNQNNEKRNKILFLFFLYSSLQFNGLHVLLQDINLKQTVGRGPRTPRLIIPLLKNIGQSNTGTCCRNHYSNDRFHVFGVKISFGMFSETTTRHVGIVISLEHSEEKREESCCDVICVL